MSILRLITLLLAILLILLQIHLPCCRQGSLCISGLLVWCSKEDRPHFAATAAVTREGTHQCHFMLWQYPLLFFTSGRDGRSSTPDAAARKRDVIVLLTLHWWVLPYFPLWCFASLCLTWSSFGVCHGFGGSMNGLLFIIFMFSTKFACYDNYGIRLLS